MYLDVYMYFMLLLSLFMVDSHFQRKNALHLAIAGAPFRVPFLTGELPIWL